MISGEVGVTRALPVGCDRIAPLGWENPMPNDTNEEFIQYTSVFDHSGFSAALSAFTEASGRSLELIHL